VCGPRAYQELVKIDRAVLRIPNLAIHLQSAKEREAFEVNKEDHLVPIIASLATKSLGGGGGGGDGGRNDDDGNDIGNDEWTKRQEPLLVRLLASELNVRPRDVIDFELNLFDVQRASFGGVHSEFVHSSRLDNLASCYLSLRGLLDHVRNGGMENDDGISMIAMFDHEEGEQYEGCQCAVMS
jgi:aspartyl aminopeptidase